MWFINGKTQHGYLLGKMSYVCDRFLEMRHLRAYLAPTLHEKQYGHQGRIRLQVCVLVRDLLKILGKSGGKCKIAG